MCEVLVVEDNEMIATEVLFLLDGITVRGKRLKKKSCPDERTAIHYLKNEPRIDILWTDWKILQTPDGPGGHPGGANLIKWTFQNRYGVDKKTNIVLATRNPQGFMSCHPDLARFVVEYVGYGDFREKLATRNGDPMITLFKKQGEDLLTRNAMEVERLVALLLEKPRSPEPRSSVAPSSKVVVVPSFN